MKNQKDSRKRSIEERYDRANKNGKALLICTILLLFMPILGYAFDKLLTDGLSFPTGEELKYLPLNYGTYGILGFVALFVVALIICTIIVFVRFLLGSGFTLFGFILSLGGTILFYGIIVSIFVGIASWAYNAVGTDFELTILGTIIDGSMPIPGASETLGVALLNTLFYGILFLFSMVGTIVCWHRCKQLKTPALEEKERREYERFILEQARVAKTNTTGLGEYSFFEGCATVEEAEIRFNKLIQIYGAEDGSGDPALAKVIRKQYVAISDQLKEHGDHMKNVGQSMDDPVI